MIKFFKYIFVFTAVLIFSFFGNQANAQEVSDIEITFGAEYAFNMASTSRISTANLSSSKFIAVYQDGGASVNQGTAIIGDVSDNVIIFGSEYVFNSANTDYLSVTALSDSKFVIAYQDISNSNYGIAIIGSISDNVITFGSEYIFNTANTDHLSVTTLSDNRFVVAYQDNRAGAKQGKAIVADVTGTTISFGDEYVFNSSVTNYTSLNAFSLDKIIITYQDGGNSDYGTAVIGTILGQVISFGSEYVFNSTATSHISPIIYSETKVVIAYQDEGGGLNYGRAIIGNINNNIITYGSEYAFNTGATSYVSVDVLDENKFVVSYQGNSGLNYGSAIIGVVSDDVVDFDLKYTFNPTSTGCNSIIRLSETKFAITYQDGGENLNYGRAIIGSIPLEEIVEPEPEPEPEPEDSVDEIEPEIIIELNDGDLIRNPNVEDLTKFDIYIVKIVGDKKFKRLILSPHVFESYEHLKWEDVQDVNQATMNKYTVSNLVRAEGDDRVYKLFPSGDIGNKRWLNIMTEKFMNQGYDSDSIYTINNTDRNAYATGEDITS